MLLGPSGKRLQGATVSKAIFGKFSAPFAAKVLAPPGRHIKTPEIRGRDREYLGNIWFLFKGKEYVASFLQGMESSRKGRECPDPWEDPKSRALHSGLYQSYGVDYGTLRWIHFFGSNLGSGHSLKGY